jgi:YidC/Oxa1 family membrane protein insertase
MTQQKPPAVDTKNMIFAVALSMAIMLGWQYFYLAPKQKAAELAAQQQQTQTQTGAGTAQVPTTQVAATTVPRDQALKAAQRIKIDTPELSGSISLSGARIDDVALNHYKETVQPGSPAVELLIPSGVANGYFVEEGLVAAPGTTAKLPDTNTVWTAPTDAILGPDKPVSLTWDNGEGLVFSREISLSDGYVFTIKQSVENKTSKAVSLLPYAGIQRQDTPPVAGWMAFFEGLLGVQNGKLTEAKYSDVAKEGGKIENESTGGWLGFTDKYWSTALIPNPARPVISTYQHMKIGQRDAYQAGYLSKEPLVVQPGTTGSYEDHVFAGPKLVDTINAIGAKYKLDRFDLMIDWGWYGPLTKFMFWLLHTAQGFVGSFGAAILVVTVLVKLAVFPIANKSYASMSKMKKLAPQMEEIKKQFPDDKMKQQQATMELYKAEKVSPLAGCLPMVIQIPVFFALYKVILTNIELRHAPFFGWINDLSAPDPSHLFNLFGLLPFTPPGYLAIGIWPILMGITMWVQMRLNPAPADPIQASMFNWMPLIFTFTLGSFPAGLVIYWSWSNLLSIIQQSYIMKRNGVDVNLFGNIRDSIPFLKRKAAT